MSDSYNFPLTLLSIAEIGVQDYSARGLTQTFEPIQAAQAMRRTVNGDLVDLSAPQFRKYRSTISCEDQLPPGFDGVFPGMALTVDCAAYLSYLTAGGSPNRTVVPESSRVEGDFTLYRPRILFRVMNLNTQENEYGAVISWNLELEEI